MSKLTLQFEGADLRDYAVGTGLTIGRMPDNALIIDNPAVSGHHARVVPEGDAIVLEDLGSTNGTFVNGQPVTRHVLQHGDRVLIGKHQLLYDQATDEQPAQAGASIQGLGDTVYLDTRQHRALRATIESARGASPAADARPVPAAASRPRRPATLRVLSGRSELAEYDLDKHTSIIGRSDTALVRLRGWFKPSVAVAISRRGDAYLATAFEGKSTINGEPLAERYELKDGDVLRVSGLTLEFRLSDAVPEESAA